MVVSFKQFSPTLAPYSSETPYLFLENVMTHKLSNLSKAIMAGTIAFAAIQVSAATFDTSKTYTTDKEIADRIEYLVNMSDPRTIADRAEDAEYRKKYSDAISIDSVVIGAPGVVGMSTGDYDNLSERYIGSEYTAFGATISNGSESAGPLFKKLKVTREHIKENSDKYALIRSVDDLYKAKEQGKVATIINSQSSDALDGELANVQKLYDAGLRQLNFSYNVTNMWSDGMGSNSKQDDGLSEMGEKLVVAMNDAGMLVDCSHSSDQTCIEAARISTKPIILSHTNARGLHDIDRNATDEAIKAVASTGGAVCVNYLGGFLNGAGDATPQAVAKHVDYIKQLVGVQATCLGSDFVQTYEQTLDPIIRNPIKYPPAQGYGSVTQMGLPGDGWGVARVLEESHGWSEAEIRMLLGENLIRIYQANWK